MIARFIERQGVKPQKGMKVLVWWNGFNSQYECCAAETASSWECRHCDAWMIEKVDGMNVTLKQVEGR